MSLPVAQSVAASPKRSARFAAWPAVVVAAVILVQAFQVVTQSYGRPGFGVDFSLLYTVAAAWREGRNPYDDAVVKETWRVRGDPDLPAPGRPVTPNVYPLTVAPLVAPLSWLPFGAAILVWSGVVLACEAWLLWGVLRGAQAARDGVRLIPVAVAVTILMLSYPMRLNLASLNIGLVVSAAAVYAVLNGGRTLPAGVAYGLALVKYSVTGPLVFLFAWRRQYRLIGVALAVQFALFAVATWGGGAHARPPLHWISDMRAEIADSLASGAINAPDAPRGGAMHLGLRSLWHRIAPDRDAWHWGVVAALVGVAGVRLVRSPRDPAAGRRPDKMAHSRRTDLDAAALLAVTLVCFYHRAYDLIPVMVLVLAWLVRPGGGANRRELLLWGALAWTIVPGLWEGWDAASTGGWVWVFVQPACAWSALALCLIPVVVRKGSELDFYRRLDGTPAQSGRVDGDAEAIAGEGSPSAGKAEPDRTRRDVVGQEETAEAAFGESDIRDKLEKPAAGGGEEARFADHAAELAGDAVLSGGHGQPQGGDQSAVLGDADVEPRGRAVDDQVFGVVEGHE